MLDPKTKIFIVLVPHRSQSTVPHDERKCGALEWSANHFRPIAILLAGLSGDFQAHPASLFHSRRKGSPRRHETGSPYLTMAHTPAELHTRVLQTREWLERHSNRCCRTCGEH